MYQPNNIKINQRIGTKNQLGARKGLKFIRIKRKRGENICISRQFINDTLHLNILLHCYQYGEVFCQAFCQGAHHLKAQYVRVVQYGCLLISESALYVKTV